MLLRYLGLDFCFEILILQSNDESKACMEHQDVARFSGDSAVGGQRHLAHSFQRSSMLVGAVVGLAFGLIRCVLTVTENLQGPASGLGPMLFLSVLMGGVSVLITLFGGFVGFIFGATVQTGREWWCANKRSRRTHDRQS